MGTRQHGEYQFVTHVGTTNCVNEEEEEDKLYQI
jgi:hypothetical protein